MTSRGRPVAPAVDAPAVDDASAADTAVVPYRARFDECGPDGFLRASALLRWAQDVAWIHSERLGFDRAWYAERGLGWLVRGLELSIVAPIPMGVTAQVTTRVAGVRRVMARRRTEVVVPDGRLAAVADTDWVMTDVVRGQPTRIPPDFPARFSGGSGVFAPIRVALPPSAPVDVAERRFAVRPHELDPMAHANNAVYVDWLEEAVNGVAGPAALAAVPRSYRLEYLQPAAPGPELSAAVSRLDDRTWRYELADSTGGQLFRATMRTG